MLRKALAIIIIVISATGIRSDASEVSTNIPVEIYVDANYKPFSYVENGKTRGIYIDILSTIFNRMKGFTVKMKPIAWEGGKKTMKKGKGFALTPAFYHGHDWPYLYPYSMPFYTETINLYCSLKVMHSRLLRWPEDYKGLTIGNVAGYDGWGGMAFRELVKAGTIQYVEVKSSEQLVKMLTGGRVDCMLMEATAMQVILAGYKLLPKNIRLAALTGLDAVHVAYSKKALLANKYPWSLEFRQQFDSIVYQMEKDDEIFAIIQNYLEKIDTLSVDKLLQ